MNPSQARLDVGDTDVGAHDNPESRPVLKLLRCEVNILGYDIYIYILYTPDSP